MELLMRDNLLNILTVPGNEAPAIAGAPAAAPHKQEEEEQVLQLVVEATAERRKDKSGSRGRIRTL